jgi:Spy/CpxP family protein refolding chaperone
MKTKYLIPALLLFCGAIVSTAIAGPRNGGGGMPEELNLSEDQKTQLQALHQEQREQRQALRDSDQRPSPEEREAMGEQFRAELAKILTPEQLATLEEHRANRPERDHRGKRGGKGHFGRGGFGNAELDLSDAQKEQLQALHETRRQKMQALRDSDQRPSPEEREALGEQFHAQLAEILTPEQLATLEAHRANRPERGHRGGKGGFGGELHLSDAQKDQVKALRETQREKMQALRNSGERPSRETVQALREEFRANFEAILTPEQLEKLAARQAERQADGTTSSSALQVAPATVVEEKIWGEVKKDTQD